MAGRVARPDESGPEVHPAQLRADQAALRFGLEVAALIGWGMFGWSVFDGAARWIGVVALPFGAAAAWGLFRVPGDASASGNAPIAVDGRIRLAVELVVLIGAGAAVAAVGYVGFGVVLVVAAAIHYLTTRRRVRWLLAG